MPDVVGMSTQDARQVLDQKGLVGVGSDPDWSAAGRTRGPYGVVTDQTPESGTKVPAGSAVTLWVGRGGGSAGVREPRRPKPDPRSGREMRYESSDEAAG